MKNLDSDTILKKYFRSQEPPFPSIKQEQEILMMIRKSKQGQRWWKVAALIFVSVGLYIGLHKTGQLLAVKNQSYIGGEKEIILEESYDRWLNKPVQ
ncbi:MAG: hypothetical protein ACRC9L_09980 [Brevinema sp.]